VLTTSIRFFDHTAHNYLGAICDDLGMQLVGSFSAAMYDLLKKEEQRRLVLFGERFFDAIEQKMVFPRKSAPLSKADFTYVPDGVAASIGADGKRVLIVHDARDDSSNLARMVARVQSHFGDAAEAVNLRQIEIRGGCMGCIQCGVDNVCVYDGTDDVREVYDKLRRADVVVLAGTITDRYLSSRWKLFFDRGFFNNHVPIFVGKQVGYLVSGPLMQIPNLRQLLEGYTELQHANVAGIVTDECGNSAQLDRTLEDFARRLLRDAALGYIGPPTFLGVAGGKLFRDEIWQNLSPVFRADHRYYKRHGFYDFPRRGVKKRLWDALLTVLLKIPAFRKEFRKRIKTEMVKPLEELLERE